MNEEIRMLEMIYNPGRENLNYDDEYQSVSQSSKIEGGGVYIQRNVNLAGQYMKYSGHRRQIMHILYSQNLERSRAKVEKQ